MVAEAVGRATLVVQRHVQTQLPLRTHPHVRTQLRVRNPLGRLRLRPKTPHPQQVEGDQGAGARVEVVGGQQTLLLGPQGLRVPVGLLVVI